MFEYIADRQRQIEQGVKIHGLATSTSYTVLNIGPGLKLSAIDFRTVPVENDEPQLDYDDDDGDVVSTGAGTAGPGAVPSPVSPSRQASRQPSSQPPSRVGSRVEAGSAVRRSLDAFGSPGGGGQGSPVASTSASSPVAGPFGALRSPSEGGPPRGAAAPHPHAHFADDQTDASSVNEVWYDAEEELRDSPLDWDEGSTSGRGGARGGGASLQSQASNPGWARAPRTESELTQRDFFYTDRLNEWAQKAAKEEAENPSLTPPSGGPLRSFIRRINANGAVVTSGQGSGGGLQPSLSELDSVEQLAGMVGDSDRGSVAPKAAAAANGAANGANGAKEEAGAAAKKESKAQQKGGWLCCFAGSAAD